MLEDTSKSNQPAARAGAANSGIGTKVAGRVTEILTERSGVYPVWIRAPKFGTDFFTGFSRAKLYEGAGKGFFRSVSIREPGQVKGTRLFHLGSILEFIESCEREAAVRKEQP